MICVRPHEEPDGFDEYVRQPGTAWLARNMGSPGRPKSGATYWTWCLGHLQDAFEWRCGYLAIYTPDGTVDHFISIHEDRSKAFEWSNYRYVSPWINSKKQADRGLLDPLEVEDEWFELILPSCQLRLTDRVPPNLREAAARTINRLGLRDHERVVRTRRRWLEAYEGGLATLDLLDINAPMIARAIRANPNYRTLP